MAYSDKVVDHYENPRNVGSMDKADASVGTGMVGAPACGDVMKLQIKVGANGVIEDAKFKTYGCGSAIASSSLVTEWVKGKSLDEALAIRRRSRSTVPFWPRTPSRRPSRTTAASIPSWGATRRREPRPEIPRPVPAGPALVGVPLSRCTESV